MFPQKIKSNYETLKNDRPLEKSKKNFIKLPNEPGNIIYYPST